VEELPTNAKKIHKNRTRDTPLQGVYIPCPNSWTNVGETWNREVDQSSTHPCQISPYWCNVSPLWSEKPQNRPWVI